MNGGESAESVFWKYVTHVPRLDAILLSHVSKTTIPGIRSLIQRKLEEKEEVFSLIEVQSYISSHLSFRVLFIQKIHFA